MQFSRIPRVTISHNPTPVESMPRLSQALGCDIWIKRDDCTGLAGGGNKTRKLEYLIADAQKQGADILLTVGGIQSNHARQTAAAAAKFGFECELILEQVSGTPTENYHDNGNLLLNQLCGAQIIELAEGQSCDDAINKRADELKAQGRRPYIIPMGGSNVIGSLGYVQCALELSEQLKDNPVDQIVLASGSAGTQAGLIAGLILANNHTPVLGINVSRSSSEQNTKVTALLVEILDFLGLDSSHASDYVHTNGDYFGPGYGIVTEQANDAVKRCASLEGILLDPVYTGKAMAGLIDLVTTNQIDKSSRQLFLHTGGSPALFAYRSTF
ncbi:L-cysteate sulfo-lyase [Vibrio stylophorae]|uniref:L-cysteate sulfo-lyase n=1 Tax=Vibrio stylophorae TaxID=659351 RepID=A0ABN8DPP3_9VIBR|nr:D-cysteine desulfhydrase [Vibrio stylophorae]CAH0532547.1 L-cysteate sulfo-lyase [Vibrio stylophorae]